MSYVDRYCGALVRLLALGLLALLLVAAFACGGGDDDDGSTTVATTPAGSGNGSDGAEATFDVEMTDQGYIPADFTVSTGAKVTLNLTNSGTAIHNLRIAGADGDYNTEDDAVSDPDLVNAGNTATVTWTAPSEAGAYLYKCDIHPDLGGTFTVK